MAEISRRTLLSRGLILAAAVGGTAFGVTRSVHHKIAVPPAPPPTGLTALLAVQNVLLPSYDRAAAAHVGAADTISQLRAEVTAHADAVRALLQHYPGWRFAQASATATPTAPSSPPAATSAAAKAELTAAVKSAQSAFADGCLAWPESEQYASQVVPILGVIAASLATHLAVLS
ncbi:hypothetical protein BH10ACT8_BH10ACT8_31960 [soil metagenome]